jgi:uncharacterized protein (DUF2249 family)
MIHWENGIFENFEFYFIEIYKVIKMHQGAFLFRVSIKMKWDEKKSIKKFGK